MAMDFASKTLNGSNTFKAHRKNDVQEGNTKATYLNVSRRDLGCSPQT